MEHDSNWEPKVLCFQVRSYVLTFLKVKNTLKMLPWGDKVTHYLVQVDMPSKSFEGSEEEYRYKDVENGISKYCTQNIVHIKYPSMG